MVAPSASVVADKCLTASSSVRWFSSITASSRSGTGRVATGLRGSTIAAPASRISTARRRSAISTPSAGSSEIASISGSTATSTAIRLRTARRINPIRISVAGVVGIVTNANRAASRSCAIPNPTSAVSTMSALKKCARASPI